MMPDAEVLKVRGSMREDAEVLKVIALPDVRTRLIEAGSVIIGNSPEAADRFLREELDKWGKVVRAAKVTPN